ncbi:MAG: hypothetical protein LBU61_06375 [Coriobacteriales bacterium]|jgi:hypothetical protein|nr:hypothetical protein [Coriobacteriales bacterium]
MFDPTSLPAPAQILQRTKALALLDAILCPDWEYRYYSFNNAWDADEQLASMRNGQGDGWFILFAPNGVAIKGYAHEKTSTNSPKIIDIIKNTLPNTFQSFIDEPAFNMNEATFCYWHAEDCWHRVDLPPDDGSDDLLPVLILPADKYQTYAADYFEIDIPIKSIEAIYCGADLTCELAKSINPEVDFIQLQQDAYQVGYVLL